MFASKDIFLKSSGGAYQISRSVRLRSSATAYFNRTFGTPTTQNIWTWSGWIKRGALTSQQWFFGAGGTSNPREGFNFLSDNTLNFTNNTGGSPSFNIITTQVFRDPSAWYHIIIAFDSTQATASNRIKVYVNGTQVTSFSTASYPSLNANPQYINSSGTIHNIGALPNGASPFDGYLTEINFIDGQALTPSSFGETNAITGVWQPKAYSGTYGTNGFELNFSDNSTAAALGTDFSGNSNTWTPNNISVTAGTTYDSMLDVPTLYADGGNGRGNYATLNPILPIPRGTISQGNLNYLSGSTSLHGSCSATFTLPITGKWYWEVTACANSGSSGNNEVIGVANILNNPQLPASGSEIGSGSRGDYAYRSDGNKYNNGNQGAYGATYTNGDVIGVAWNSDSGTITFYKNGTTQGTAFSSIVQVADKFVPASSNAETSNGDSFNFGQRPFSYTPPTGFVALNTQNLPTPTISNGAQYMAATTYTGTGSALTIANTVGSASFQPDLVWVKGRSGATDHAWYDAVRGVQLQLESNNTAAETTETTGLTAFGSTGFTVGALAQMNTSAATYVAWQWNAGGSTVTNTSGTISSQVRANATAGFSVVTYTGTGVAATIGHGLGVAPKMIIVKRRNSAVNWSVYNSNIGNTNYLQLNSTVNSTAQGANNFWNSTNPTSSVFSVGTITDTNASGGTYVAYCFAEVAGYSAFGSYTGNGSTDGPFVYLGFRPKYVMTKRTDTTSNWYIQDTSRSSYNLQKATLFAESSAAEAADGGLDFLSNGFKLRNTDSSENASGGTYIYMAFAENPFKLSLAR